MIFEGMESWTKNEPFVELVSGGRIIDLHNCATFLGFEFRVPETILLSFDFDETGRGLREGSTSKELRLRFEGVSDIQVHQQELEHVYEAFALDEFLFRELRPGRGWIEVTMMDGFMISFEAGSVALEEEVSSTP